MQFGEGYMYPQDQEFQFRNSWLPGSGTSTSDTPLLQGLQPFLVDRIGNPFAQADRQLGDFSDQLRQRVPNDNNAYQCYNPIPQISQVEYAQAIRNGCALNPPYQPNHSCYCQANHTGSTSTNANLETIPSPETMARREYPNMALREYPNKTVGTSTGAPNGHSMPSLQSFVDKWGRAVPISSLLDILSQPGNTSNFNQMKQSARMEMASFPANDKQGNHANKSGLSAGAFHVLDHHDYKLNQPPRTDNNTCYVDLVANLPVTLDKFREVEKFQLSTTTEYTIVERKSIEDEAIQHSCGVLQNIVGSSTAASTLSTKTVEVREISDQGIDVNETPQQKPVKRRKHRPKVVIEGKPKRSRRTTTNKSATSNEKSSGKRKYVRRKGLMESDQKAGSRKKTADSNTGRARMSCKRTLDFDLHNSEDKNKQNIVYQHEMQQINRSFDLNSISEDTGLCSRFDGAGKMESKKTKISLQNSVKEQEFAHTFPAPSTSCNEHELIENNFVQNKQKTSSNHDIYRFLHTGNLSFTNRHGESGNDPSRYSRRHEYAPIHQLDLEGTGQTVFQVNSPGCHERNRKLISHTARKNVIQYPINPCKARGLGYNNTDEQPYPHATNTMSKDVLGEAECHRHSCSTGTASKDCQKKRKMENKIPINMPASHSILLQSQNDTVHSGINKPCNNTSHTFESVPGSYSASSYSETPNTGVNNFSDSESLYSRMSTGISFSGQHNLSPPEPCIERVEETKKLTQFNSSTPQIEVSKRKLTPQTPAKTTRAVRGQPCKSRPVKRSTKHKKAATTTFTPNVPDTVGAPQEQDSSSDYVHTLQKTRGEAAAHMYPYIDEVIKLFNSLNIRAISDQYQKALVPYGGSGAIIPLDTKKKRPRPKVDLDTETIRVWNLLMGIEGGTETDTMHKGSGSWWENERKVFRGRADSFIARMRLVQGDRHFSRWKGSVVDSVIGVFLTKNVSDHLSSSAFMTLAAAFPLKLKSSRRAGSHDSAGMLVEEPETCVPDPKEPARHGKVSYRITETSGTEIQSFHEDIISSQDSFHSSVIQGTDSNSETEDPTPRSAYLKIQKSTSTNVLSIGKATPLDDNLNRITECSMSNQRSSDGHTRRDNLDHEQQTVFVHLGNSDDLLEHSPAINVENYQLNTTDSEALQRFNEESSSSWPSTTSGLSHANEVAYSSSMIGQRAIPNSCTVQNQGLLIFEEKPLRDHNALTENHCMHQQSTSTPISKTTNCQQSGIHSQLESTTETKQVNLTKVLDDGETSTIQHNHNVSEVCEDTFEVTQSNLMAEKQRELENVVGDPASKDQPRPPATASKGSNNTINKRKKGNSGREIKPDEHWESLRKQVKAEGTNKERCHDAMDSMDYEAIRHANVNYISGVIKERGMNNRLAERMKEFLNRLVRVHGSIDLEWLRDVSPDEAKDYLLNIWGIGLKSVECVRLLTLHHLAFPVDTNVGRIAVRLGWVPLQPLPESLQLHLLELYPILDTIQKYLWPRLCKLDQQTLYELHYHLITFGKVFCTKHKPNCNACPMRGECRHFASAFASARLALPGPEEKNIVSSCSPIASEGDTPSVINTVPQLTAESSSLTGICVGKSKCQPIIEEPKTPEPESIEALEYDIEDTLWEDPNEIPFFRLNMQEFTENMQNYVQANMELQESDVSKALVALTPDAASIPAPKLKNVNRLRTEHQVYELPDLHPLLEGMDRREPDDPSPYLFAIWTPGETANTVQPPESICCSQETGQLCHEMTCFTCNSIRESDSQTVRGTLLIPCRTAMRGRFPLNGTYFQVNEVFADDKSSKDPIAVPRQWLWNLPRRTVYFGTSVTSIFRGLTTEQIQLNFWRGFVCVRGFDQETRAPRPLVARLHCSLARLAKDKMEKAKDGPLTSKDGPLAR